jgi:uncharacterized membrane protein YjgN (DUF898 family)
MDSNEQPQTEKLLFSYHGDTADLFKIYLVNFFLTIITLGIYRFWGKTRIRKYLWSHIEIEGDRLEYTGTPKELFIGFLVVLFIILIPLFGLPEIFLLLNEGDNPTLQSTIGAIQFLLIVLLVPAALYRARRYRLSRTQWRGIRAGQTGSAAVYSLKNFFYTIGGIFTLWLTMPLFRTKLASYRLNNTWIGNSKLTFEATASPLYNRFFIMIGLYILLFILMGVLFGATGAVVASLGLPQNFDLKNLPELKILIVPIGGIFVVFFILAQIPRFWYIAGELKYFASKTKLGELKFQLKITGWRYAWFILSNELLTLLSLGFALPYVYNRYLRYFAANLTFSGNKTAFLISQSKQPDPKTGEGLADAFDVGGF